MPDRTPVIAGIGLSDYPKAPALDAVQHHALALQRTLDDCGLAKREIDGYVSAGGGGGMMIDDAVTMAEYLGIDHRWVDGTMTGGSSFEFHVQHAAAAIRHFLEDGVKGERAQAYMTQVLDNPDAFAEKTVRVSGHVRSACSRKGCWMELAPTADKTAQGSRDPVEETSASLSSQESQST